MILSLLFSKIGFADFCMDPIPNTINLVPRDVYNVTSYYTTCQGVNPLQSTIDTANSYVDDMRYGIEQVMTVPGCENNQYLEDSLLVVDDIEGVINDVNAQIICNPTQYQVQQVLESGLCQDSFRGIYTIWLTQYVSAALLLVTTIVISLIYQYFGRYWSDINNEDESPEIVVHSGIEVNQPNGPDEIYQSTSTIHDRSNFA